MFGMPTGSDIAGFGANPQALSSYLQSPSFQANTTLGGFLGSPGASFQTPWTTGQFGAGGGFGGAAGGGLFSMDGLKLIGGGLSTIGNLWNAFQAQKLARDTFNFQKEFANTNLANQIKSYNTALSDRARSRGFTEGQTQEQIDQYVSDNELSR